MGDELIDPTYFERSNEENKFKEYLLDFDKNRKNLLTKRGLYVYGEPGSGKTSFVMKLLKTVG